MNRLFCLWVPMLTRHWRRRLALLIDQTGFSDIILTMALSSIEIGRIIITHDHRG